MADRSTPAYQLLLEEALELGRLDGRFAADFEPPGNAHERSGRCLGRTPSEFARLLWEHRPGNSPAGLEANAPTWYALGFTEGLTARRAELRSAADRARTRRVFT
jgi:hypothetical protein